MMWTLRIYGLNIRGLPKLSGIIESRELEGNWESGGAEVEMSHKMAILHLVSLLFLPLGE